MKISAEGGPVSILRTSGISRMTRLFLRLQYSMPRPVFPSVTARTIARICGARLCRTTSDRNFENFWDFANDAPFFETAVFNAKTGIPFGNRQDDRENLWGAFVQDDFRSEF